MKYIYTQGLIASGKSTWAKEFVKANQDFKRLNRDSFRFMLSDYTYDDKNEELVQKLMLNSLETLIKSGYNVVIDEQNLNEKRMKQQMDWIKKLDNDAEFSVKPFPITLGEAIERDSKREFPIGKNVIKKTWQAHEILLKNMLDAQRPKVTFDAKLPGCFLFDIDGNLAKAVNRNIFDETKVATDEPVEAVLRVNNIIRYFSLKKDDNLCIIIVSGRQDSCLDETKAWLEFQGVGYDRIFMRKAGDKRPDTIIKKEIYEEHIKNNYNVLGIFDDRPSVCQMWIEQGLFVFNTNQDPMCKNNF